MASSSRPRPRGVALSQPAFLGGSTQTQRLARRYLDALLGGRRQEASQLVLRAVQEGASVRAIYLEVFQPALYEVGRLWQQNEISVAEEHFFTAATQLAMSQLYPYIFTPERKDLAMVAACVGDELHEVGVRMVADFFEMEGWDSYYLGANVPAGAILDALRERRPQVLAVSATMSYHVGNVRRLIAQVRELPDVAATKILVGGWCFRAVPTLWKEVGADGFASDAGGAVDAALALLPGAREKQGSDQ